MAFHIHIHKCVVVVDTIGIPLSDTFPVMVVRSAEENGERERESLAFNSFHIVLFLFYCCGHVKQYFIGCRSFFFFVLVVCGCV